MNNRRSCTLPLLSALAAFHLIAVSSASPLPSIVIPYPQPPGARTGSSFSVTVNGTPVPVEEYRGIGYCHFAFAGQADIQVRIQEPVKSFRVSPTSFQIKPVISGDTISFSLTVPRKLMIHDINSWNTGHESDPTNRRLFIFADPLEEDRPDPASPSVINVRDRGIDNTGVTNETAKIQILINEASSRQGTLLFPPGTYRVEKLFLKNNMAVYLAGGARIQADDFVGNVGSGAVLAMEDVKNVKIYGRGSIDGNGIFLCWDPAGPRLGSACSAIRSDRSDNIIIRDVILQNPAMFSVWLRNSSNANIANIKLVDYANDDLGLYAGQDGIDPDSCRNVDIDNVFICSGDDCTSTKFAVSNPRWPVAGNINIRNSVFYNAGHGNMMGIGNEILRGAVQNVTFENIDVIRAHMGFVLWNQASPADTAITNIFYKNIRVQKVDAELVLAQSEGGTIGGIVFQNVTVDKNGSLPFPLTAKPPTGKISSWQVNGMRVNGIPLLGPDRFIMSGNAEPPAFSAAETPVLGVRAGKMVADGPSSPASFTFWRTGDTSSPLTVHYRIHGTARSGVDYVPFPTSITFPPGSSEMTVSVIPKTKTVLKTVMVSLLNSPLDISYALGPDFHSVVVLAPGSSPTVAQPASAKFVQPQMTEAALAVLGADDGGEHGLTYTWSVKSGPAPASFSLNGTNGSKKTRIRFTQTGSYILKVVITDAGGLTAESLVSVQVSPRPVAVKIHPRPPRVLPPGAAVPLSVAITDQFGHEILPLPPLRWTVFGGGSVSSGGVFQAPRTRGTRCQITVFAGRFSDTVFVVTDRRLSGSRTVPPVLPGNFDGLGAAQ